MGFIVAFLFLSNREYLHMIHHDLDLFYDIYNIINKHNQRPTNYLSLMFLTQFDISKTVKQNCEANKCMSYMVGN